MKYTDYNQTIEKELLGRARELQPLLRKRAPEFDANRRISEDVFKELSDAGFWEMASPRRWGGLGTSSTTMARVGAELGKGDPSVGWVYTVLHGTTWVASLGPDALQEEIFGNGKHPTICGAVTPPGQAQEVDGGYIVNGKWAYCSGSRHADWGQFGCNIVKEDGTVEPGGNVYIPMSEIEIEDTWFMVGMKGTGSETCVAKDIFVPKSRFFHIAKLGIGKHEAGKKHVGEPSDYWPFMPFLRATAHGMVVGAAEAMLEEVVETSKTRPIVYTNYTRQADSALVHGKMGNAAAKVAAAKLLMEKTCGQIDSMGITRIPMTAMERAQSKGEGAFTIDLLAQAADELMFLAGSSAFAESKAISRYWRDLNVGARHVANLPYVGYEILGKALVGFEPNITPADFI
ncbi:MAG: acyl-CoA dehydrogenase family protein [Spongiibacteraceae bacterium]